MAITKDIQLFQAQENEAKKVTLKDHVAYRNRQPETVAKDFNTYTETGFYSWDDTAVLTQCANRPCDEAGTLEVLNNKSETNPIIYHRYLTDTNKIYLNSCVNSVWGSWVMTADKAYVDTALEALQGDVNQDLSGMQNTINQINQNVAKKINRTDTKTFFLEPSKWSDGKYTLDVTGFGWTANTIIQINAPLPESNIELASGISIESQSMTSVVLKAETVPTEPVILTLLYGGEETTGYYVVDEIGTQTITWVTEEEQDDPHTLFLFNAEGSTPTERFSDKSMYGVILNKEEQVITINYIHGERAFDESSEISLGTNSIDFSKPWQIEFTYRISPKSGYTFYCLLINDTRFRIKMNYNGSDMNIKIVSMGSDIDCGYMQDYTYYYFLIQYDGSKIYVYGLSELENMRLIYSGNMTFVSNPTVQFIKASGANTSHWIDEIRMRDVLDENPLSRNHLTEEAFKRTHTVEVEHSQEIQVTEKSWYDRRSDGLYKWDTTTNAWVKQTTTS